MSEEEKVAPPGGVLGFLQKIGMPGIIAAVVSAVITTLPFLFQLDERYAKAEVLDAQLVVVSKQINDLTIEVGRLAGVTQVIVAVMSAKPEVRLASIEAPPISPPVLVTDSPPIISTVIPKTAEERKTRLMDVSKSLEHTQSKVLQIQQQTK